MDKREKYQEVFSTTSVNVLKESTRNILIQQLDETRIREMRNGTLRDWRGFKDLTNSIIPSGYCISYMEIMLKNWESNPENTIENLLGILKQMERYDIIDDIIDLMYDDAVGYKQSNKLRIQIPQKIQDDEVSSASNFSTTSSFTSEVTTVHDIENSIRQLYDSYVCYEDDDVEFVQQMILNLEQDHQLQLCIPERDLTAHGLVDHSAIINFIRNRCKSMVIVLSESFTRSKQNSFLTMLAQAISIEAQSRFIIPVIYKTCVLPTTLQALSKLDLTRGDKFDCFWVRLATSIRQSSSYEASQFNIPSSMLSVSSSSLASPSSPNYRGDKSPILLHTSSSSGYSSYSMNLETKMEIERSKSEENLRSHVNKKKNFSNKLISSNIQGNNQEKRPSTSTVGTAIFETASPTPSKKTSFTRMRKMFRGKQKERDLSDK